MKKNELKEKAKYLEPVLRIGKNGLTEGVVGEIKKQLKKKKLIKIKFLKSFIETHDRKEAAKEMAEKTSSELISHVGFVIVLWKR